MAKDDNRKKRTYTREIKEVQDLAKSFAKVEDTFDGMDDAAKKVLGTVGGITKLLATSGDFSEKNTKQARLLAKASQASLNFAKSKSSADKEIYDSVKKQYETYRDLGGEQIDTLDTLIKAGDEIAVQEGLWSKIKDQGSKILNTEGKAMKTLEKSAGSVLTMVGAGGGLLAIFSKFTDLTKVIGDNFGAIGMTTPEIKDGLLGASVEATKLGFGMADVASTVNELTSNFGFSLEESIKLSSSVLDTSKALGLSNAEGATLIGTLSQVTGLSLEASTNFAKQTALLAKQQGVAPNVVLKDIAASSESIAKFTDASGENIGKAAIMATKLGTNLNTVAAVAEGLLDFQSSIGKEIEASIMLGRDLNFQKARELALNNDIEGAMAEVVGQLGTEEEFTRLNALQRKSLAESIGVSVDQLAKFVTNQDKAKTIGEAISAQPGLEEMIGPNAIDAMAQIVNNMKAVGAELVVSIGPSISTIAGGIASFTKSLSDSKMLLPAIGALLGFMATKSMIVAVASLMAAAGQMGIKTGGIGLLPGLILAGGAITGMIGVAASFQDLGPGIQATPTPGSEAMAHGKGTYGSETILHTNEIVEAMELQDKRNKENIKEQARAFAREMDSVLTRLI